uniref:Uncharacterized protein n=1 Tax=Anopheles funestus TaxID=62324 RepID=A0A182S1G5_ANOFN
MYFVKYDRNSQQEESNRYLHIEVLISVQQNQILL